ncbi:unnamed protein product, partial [marine sediment metagenome]
KGNTITNNVGTGIQITATSQLADIAIHDNNIFGNGHGVSSDIPTDATLNWWGVTFLTEVDERVSGEVDFTPWLSAPIDKDYEPVSENPELDSKFYRIGDPVYVTVYDWDENKDSMAEEEVTVQANSLADKHGDTEIILTEDGANTGVFKGSFNLIGEPPADRDANEIVVSEDDTITVAYPELLTGFEVTARVDELLPEFVEVVGKDYYANTQKITLEADLGESGLTVTADFSAIDSEVTLLKAADIDDPLGIYTITHEISEENTRPDGEYTIPIEAKDAAGNSATYNFVTTLDN